MLNILLVCTVHTEKGKLNSFELLNILNQLQPQVIFLEVPVSGLDIFFSTEKIPTLESRAVKQYKEVNAVELVPVDLPTPELNFFKINEYLHKRVHQASHKFQELSDWNSQHVSQYGFSYLNSEYSSNLWKSLYEEMTETIVKIDDPILKDYLESWHNLITKRDIEMLDNIYKYARNTSLQRGAFLVGASHRSSIIEKSLVMNSKEPDCIRWNYLNLKS